MTGQVLSEAYLQLSKDLMDSDCVKRPWTYFGEAL